MHMALGISLLKISVLLLLIKHVQWIPARQPSYPLSLVIIISDHVTPLLKPSWLFIAQNNP